ncbi:MAG: glycosyl transferase family 8, partial [Caulobacter sp.]|nr:glycosyl transferase family 8 [Caulobacter sp.]
GGGRLIDLAPDLSDFAETAAALECLDLLISADTAPVHLAGALNRPCWVLLPHAADWRWLTEREDSPWYPSLRLFRQAAPGGWAGTVARAAEALARFAQARRP